MKAKFQKGHPFHSACFGLLVMGLLDQKSFVSAYSWQPLHKCERIERLMFCCCCCFVLTYSSFCLCGMYIMAHGREGFPKTQVTSAHDCILNDSLRWYPEPDRSREVCHWCKPTLSGETCCHAPLLNCWLSVAFAPQASSQCWSQRPVASHKMTQIRASSEWSATLWYTCTPATDNHMAPMNFRGFFFFFLNRAFSTLWEVCDRVGYMPRSHTYWLHCFWQVT